MHESCRDGTYLRTLELALGRLVIHFNMTDALYAGSLGQEGSESES